MSLQFSKIDFQGRVQIPIDVLEPSGLHPGMDIYIELQEGGILIKPKKANAPITQKFAEMNLPVSDWKDMEDEIESGYLK